MEYARYLLRWALPGWAFFLFVGLFHAVYLFVASGLQVPFAGSVLLDTRINLTGFSPEAAVIFLFAIGIALGFVFAQIDTVLRTSALPPLSSGVPDPGGEILSYVTIDPVLVVRLVAPRRPLLEWEPSEHRPAVRGTRLPWWEGGLWTVLSLFWVPRREQHREDIQLNSDLAEVHWLRATRDQSTRRIFDRVIELIDREETLGACRVALASAYAVGYVVTLVVLLKFAHCRLGPVLGDCGDLLPGAAATAVVVALLAIFLLRESRAAAWGIPLPVAAAVGASLILFGRPEVLLVGSALLAVSAILSAVWLVRGLYQWIPLLFPQAQRSPVQTLFDRIGRTSLHWLAISGLVSLAFWWTLADVRPDVKDFGFAYAVNLAFALALLRIFNAARRLLRERRVALQIAFVAQ